MNSVPHTRPDMHSYFMQIALAVRERANCVGNRVGAVLVVQNRIVSTGYNGTPSKTKNCDEGGCERCANRARYGPGEGYDLCICVHAEQNALLSAARFGVAVAGATLYSTMRPCFGCTKELLQAASRPCTTSTTGVIPKPPSRRSMKPSRRDSPVASNADHRRPKADWAVSKKKLPDPAQ